jgi:hypothetical protein
VPPFTTAVTPPKLEWLIQLPLTEKHPEVRLRPLANVDDAVVEVVLRMEAAMPAANVDVAVVDVAVM